MKKTFRNQTDLTAFWEQGPKGGCATEAYLDDAGIPTIGFGSTKINGKPVTLGMKITVQCAHDELVRELMFLESKIEDVVDSHYPTQIMDAICDYAYNLGLDAMPTLIKKMQADDFSGASLEFLNGIYYTDPKTNLEVPASGLLRRRISEYNTFMGKGYIAWEEGDPVSQDLMDKLVFMNAHSPEAIAMINQLRVQ